MLSGFTTRTNISAKSLANDLDSTLARDSSNFVKNKRINATTDIADNIQYTTNHSFDFGLPSFINWLIKIFPIKTPAINIASRIFIKLPCSFWLLVIIPIVAKTETFIIAKETPITKNNILKYQKAFEKGIIAQIIATNAKPINIDFFNPILGKKEAIKKEVMAIGKSLNPSKMEASAFEISKFLCT